jgi:hypothetical protein
MASSSVSSCTLVTITIQPSMDRTAVALVRVCMAASFAALMSLLLLLLLFPGAWGGTASSISISSGAILKASCVMAERTNGREI